MPYIGYNISVGKPTTSKKREYKEGKKKMRKIYYFENASNGFVYSFDVETMSNGFVRIEIFADVKAYFGKRSKKMIDMLVDSNDVNGAIVSRENGKWFETCLVNYMGVEIDDEYFVPNYTHIEHSLHKTLDILGFDRRTNETITDIIANNL